MELTLKELLGGQPTVIKHNEYLSTAMYVTPFVERMSKLTDDIRCRAIEPTQLSISSNGELNKVYNKVLVEAVMPVDGQYADVIGMAYSLDARKPVCKFFRGIKENLDNGQLYINNDNYIINQPIEPESRLNYKQLYHLVDEVDSNIDWVYNLKTIDFNTSNDEVNYKLGQWIRFAINFNVTNEFGTIKIATADIISGYKEIFENSKSNFFKGLGVHTDYLNIYSAISKVLYDGKDIINLPDKTYLLKSILSIA